MVTVETGEAHVCTAANRRYLGQHESNGYCYSLFRNNPKLVRELTSRVASSKAWWRRGDRGSKISIVTPPAAQRGSLPARQIQTPSLSNKSTQLCLDYLLLFNTWLELYFIYIL